MIVVHKDGKIFKLKSDYSADIYFGKNSGTRINMIGHDKEHRVIKIGNNTKIKGVLNVAGNLKIGHDCNILGQIFTHRHVRIGNHVTIGGGCTFAEGVRVHNSCNIGHNCKFMKRCLIRNNVTINSNIKIMEDVEIPEFFHIKKVENGSYSYIDLYRGTVILEGIIMPIIEYYDNYKHRKFYKYVKDIQM